MIFIGVDPGMSGAIAVLDQERNCGFVKNSTTESDLSSWLRLQFSCSNTYDGSFAYIERVSAMPKQGVSSTFKFGQSYGFLRGLLIAHRVPFEEVSPRKWQSAMGCLSGGDKNVTKARAQQLFPQVKVTHAIADALLLAEYCRRVKTGELERASA